MCPCLGMSCTCLWLSCLLFVPCSVGWLLVLVVLTGAFSAGRKWEEQQGRGWDFRRNLRGSGQLLWASVIPSTASQFTRGKEGDNSQPKAITLIMLVTIFYSCFHLEPCCCLQTPQWLSNSKCLESWGSLAVLLMALVWVWLWSGLATLRWSMIDLWNIFGLMNFLSVISFPK